MRSFVRISALLWPAILVEFALFVMQKYLTDVWKLSFPHAAGILNIWNGISMILPVFFLFFVDALLGHFGMLLISSVAYSVGIGFVTMSTPPVLANSTGTCKKYEQECIEHVQKALFYTGMALIAVGMAGNGVSVQAFIKEQGDRPENDEPLLSFARLIGAISVVIIPIVGAIALPYIKPWKLRFGIPAICTVVATFLFLTGLCWVPYEKEGPKGSPVTNICRVFVACVSKRSQPFPPDDNKLYKRDDDTVRSFKPTSYLRCLEKAAIIREDISKEEQEQNRWKFKLCSVAEVEEVKIAVRMIPMWLTFIVCGMVSSMGNTYFVEQANKLNRHIGKLNVPITSLLLFFKWVKGLVGGKAKKHLEKHKKYGPPVGIAAAMVFSILCCITAAKIEQRRLNAIRKHDLIDKADKDNPMSIYWMLFQFFLLAGLDGVFEKSVEAFYKGQAPGTMKGYLEYLAKGVYGLGFMFNVLSVYVVGKISEKGGKPNWFQFTLNKSRLDQYYWVLTVLSSVNLIAFIVVASCYRYKDVEAPEQGAPEGGGTGVDTGGEAEHKQLCYFCFE